MTVDVVSEQRWRIRSHATRLAIRQQAALHQSLETVAYAQDKASACLQGRYCRRYLLVIDDIRNELAATVGLVSRRESAAEGKDMAFVDAGRQGVDGIQNVLGMKVAEYEGPHLRTGLPESLCRVVVAVRSRKYWKAYDRMLHRCAGKDALLLREGNARTGVPLWDTDGPFA